MTSNFSSIDDRYTQEFQHHNPDILGLNVRSVDLSWSTKQRGGEEIENDDVLFILESLNWTVTRLHNGRVNDSTLKKVKKMIGGWHITPFYGLADRAEINSFRFKPDNPTAQWSNGKVSTDKYIGAVGELPRAYCPNIPEALWATIAARYGVEKSGNNFWEWILDHPEIPVIITEGEKKAYSGLCAGCVVISLPGIDSGYKSSSENDDGRASQLELIPDLEALASSGRTIYIAFDRDSNPQTVKRVQKARQKLAQLFGKFGCETRSIRWDEQYKGFDDFIFGAGQEALDKAIESAQDITPKIRAEGEKDKTPSALEMSKKVFRDLFENVIRFDASVKQYWRYDGRGKWVGCSDEYIFGVAQEYLEETIDTFSPNYVENVIRFGKKDILHEGWTEASNLLYIPFENGVLEVKTKKLLPHSPDYGFTWQLPRPWSAIEASWGNIDRFLNELCVGNEQLKNIVIAFCNAILTGRSDLQKFLYLSGSGGNGKGSLIRLLVMLVGIENTHSTSLTELNENRFEPANLKGKRLVVMPDEDKRVGGIGVFKSATGQDPIRYERKGKDSTTFTFQGMMVIGANAPTFVGDSGTALQRRKVDLPCMARIPESQHRNLTPEFEADLTTFTTCLLSLPDDWVTDTIRGASSVDAVKQLNWEMTVREDSIAAFYSDRLIIDSGGSEGCGDLYKSYQSYCEESGNKPKSIKNFSSSLIELCNDTLGHSIGKKRTKAGETIQGLRIRQAREFEEDTSENTDKIFSSLLKNNLDLLRKSDNPTHPTPLAQSNGFNPTLTLHQPYTTLHQPCTNSGKSTPKVGDRVEYTGANKSLQIQYAGVLEIFEIKGDSYTCKKLSGSLTSWIELEDLQFVEVAK